MIELQLTQIWQNFSQKQTIELNTPKLLIEMNNNLQSAEKRANRRDKRETIGALAGVVLFIYFGFKYDNTFTWAACVFTIVVMFFVVFRLRIAKKRLPVDFLSFPLIKQLEFEKKYVLTQQKLLSTAMYWYALPLFLANVFFVLSMSGSNKVDNDNSILSVSSENIGLKLVVILGLFVMHAYIGWMNKKAARVNWAPVAEELEQLENQLKG